MTGLEPQKRAKGEVTLRSRTFTSGDLPAGDPSAGARFLATAPSITDLAFG